MADKKRGNRRRASLSARQKDIIQILAQSASKPVTASVISEKLNVSSRTILREMPIVEKWLTDNDFRFTHKPGIGLRIEEDEDNLALILELLEVENVASMYSRQERRRHILGELFFTEEPMKALLFSSRFHISNGTLSDDFDALNGWLKGYSLQITRRSGYGAVLSGEEPHCRRAIADAVFEFVDTEKLLPLLTNEISPAQRQETLEKTPLLRFLTEANVRFANDALADCEKSLSVKYMDSSRIGLVVRLCLAVFRMGNGRLLNDFPQNTENASALPEWEAAGEIVRKAKETFSVTPTAAEQAAVALYLSSARIRLLNPEAEDPMRTISIRRIVISMAGVVERLTGLPFRTCTGMIDDLVAHIDAVIHRASVDIGLENPRTDLVSQNYPEIFSAVEAACELLRDFSPTGVSPAETEYIAMHFAAEAERIQEQEQKVVAAVVCPAGIGSSKILAANLKKSFRSLEIRKILSAFDINPRKLREEGIDLIISTARLQTDFPHVSVGMVPQAQDRMMLENKIEEINRRRLNLRTGARPAFDVKIDLDFVLTLSAIGGEIAEILQNFRIRTADAVSNHYQLVECSAALFGETPFETAELAAGIRRREELGNTYFPGMNIYLFHCKTRVVRHSRFGFVRLKTPLITKSGPITGAVVMLVPREGSEKLREPIGRLSSLLVEEPDFLQALQSGDATAGVALAEEALVKYFQKEITKRIGVEV